ncbi:MAG TPA: hypothetical protein DCL08_02030 [Anaerolineaceae bacterium]|nr:hypothetical protein [Anaerolineaceae bacterium]
MNRKIFIFSLIIFFLLPNLSACNSASNGPEKTLWGTWKFVDNQNGSNEYFFDLEFQEDGSLVLAGDDQNNEFVVIAPGRLKISKGEESEVVNYEIADDILTLYFESGTNQYKRITQATAVAQLPTNNAAPEDSTLTPGPLPTLSPATPTTGVPTENPPTETPETLEPEETAKQIPDTGSSFTREIDGMVMMYIPEGSFLMGSTNNDSSAFTHEKPRHKVYLDAFWMDAYEVSNDMFLKFVESTGYQTLAEEQGYSYMYNSSSTWTAFDGVNWRHPMGDDSTYQNSLPVTHVNKYEAQAYCAWVGGRLPTEAEWEKAARGDDGRIYPWGNSFDSAKVHNNSSGGPISIYASTGGASPYGIYNLAGNVFEWTNDWYDANYYEYSPYDNPQGPSGGEWIAVRGGGWKSSNRFVRTSHRDISTPDAMNYVMGFRCVMDP